MPLKEHFTVVIPSVRFKVCMAFAAASILAMLSLSAPAAEGGLSNFPFGAQTTYAAFMPTPGTTSFFGYALYINADEVRDGNGDEIPGVSLDAFAFAPRLLHTWNTSFHGWKLTSGAVTELIYADVKTPGDEDEDIGPTLIGIEPLYLSKTIGAWTFLHGPLIYLPLGSFDRSKLANSNLNYNSYAYQGSVTWHPNARLEMSLNAAVEFKDENSATRYHSGPQAGLTFGMGYKAFADQSWDIGFSGFYSDGLADDERDGRAVAGGGRTRRFAIGPKVVYWLSPEAAIVVQWHREMATENAAQGDQFWLECTFPF